jgi:hypothetical protein
MTRIALTVCLVWCVGCAERTLVVGPPPGNDAGAQGGAGGGVAQKVGGACPPAGIVRSFCPGNPPCWKTCGPDRAGFRNCACNAAGAEECGDCQYEPGQDLSCFALPDPVPVCPPSPDAGQPLPQGTTRCEHDPCQPCGSSTSPGYIDSSGAPKAGYCVCVPNPDAGFSVYSCAPVANWPPS